MHKICARMLEELHSILHKHSEIWEAAPTAHITASKGSSPGLCVHCVGMKIFNHRATANIIHLHRVALSQKLQEFLQVMCSLLELKSFRTLKELFMPFRKHAYIFWNVFDWPQMFFCEKKYAHWVLNELQIVPRRILFSECERIRSNVKSEWKYGSPVHN